MRAAARHDGADDVREVVAEHDGEAAHVRGARGDGVQLPEDLVAANSVLHVVRGAGLEGGRGSRKERGRGVRGENASSASSGARLKSQGECGPVRVRASAFSRSTVWAASWAAVSTRRFCAAQGRKVSGELRDVSQGPSDGLAHHDTRSTTLVMVAQKKSVHICPSTRLLLGVLALRLFPLLHHLLLELLPRLLAGFPLL